MRPDMRSNRNTPEPTSPPAQVGRSPTSAKLKERRATSSTKRLCSGLVLVVRILTLKRQDRVWVRACQALDSNVYSHDRHGLCPGHRYSVTSGAITGCAAAGGGQSRDSSARYKRGVT